MSIESNFIFSNTFKHVWCCAHGGCFSQLEKQLNQSPPCRQDEEWRLHQVPEQESIPNRDDNKCAWDQRSCTVRFKLTSRNNNFYAQSLLDATVTGSSSTVAAGDGPLPVEPSSQCPLDMLSKHLAHGTHEAHSVLCFVVRTSLHFTKRKREMWLTVGKMCCV